MNLLDIFEGREPYQQAIDKLEQRRIADLEARMDDCARRGDKEGFQKCKAERDSYYKIKEGEVTRTSTGIKHRSTDAYGGTAKEKDPLAKLDKATTNSLEKSMGVRFDREKKYQGGLDLDEGSMKHMMHKDAERMSREQFCEKYGNEHGEFWDNIMGDLDEGKWNYPDYMTQKANQDDEAELGISGRNKDRRKEWRKKQKAQAHKELMTGKKKEQHVDEAGIGHDIADKKEKIARATPQTRAGAVASTVKNAAKWLAGKGGPGKEGPTYESVEEGNPSKKVFKDKSGKPVGEIGIDPESSPGNGEWYVYHYGTGYSVVGFDNAAEAKRELMYVHKHPEAVEGHESTFNEAAQKKNSEEVDEGFQDFNKVEPYAVCLAGKPVKKFDYYEDARRFHDNWKKKLYNQGEKEKADKITLMPLNLDEDTGSWIVYDPETKQIKKRFKTHTAGKSYAKTHGLGFASSEYYFDNVKPTVAEMDKSQKSYNRHGDYSPGDKGTIVKPVTAKKVVKDLSKELDAAFNTPELLKKDADYRAYRKGVRQSRKEQPKTLPPVDEEKTRLDPKCWKGKKIGNPKTKMKGGVRVNNCVPAEESYTGVMESQGITDAKLLDVARRIDAFAKTIK